MVHSLRFYFVLLVVVVSVMVAVQLMRIQGVFLDSQLLSTSKEDNITILMPGRTLHSPSSNMEYYNPKYRSTGVDPVVSIITPVYVFNETKIQETVASILRQSLQNWEWVIADDAVIENEKLKTFVKSLDDKRIRLVRKGHLGLAGARNYAISESRAPYFYNLDDDDLIGHDALELLYFSLTSNPTASFVNGFSYGFGEKNFLWPMTYGNPKKFLSINLGTYALMGRKDHWESVDGYDNERKGGLEDWDFTLRLMNQKKWGYTIPEYVFWYRTRKTHSDRWTELSQNGLKKFVANIPLRYPNLKAKIFPRIECPNYSPYAPIETGIVQPNGVVLEPLLKTKQRMLLIVPWLTVGGADKFNKDFVQGMVEANWEVTIVATLKTVHRWRDAFSNLTSDIFILSNFLPYAHYPRFFRHLLISRNPDVVMTSNSGLGYNLMPYLTASCPQAVFVDYAHAEHMSYLHGGWPKLAAGLSPWYDVNFVASSHLRDWMISNGVSENKAQVLHVGVYAEEYGRNIKSRQQFRKKHNIKSETTVITFAARMDENKQPLFFCHVATEILKKTKHQSLHFIAAGNGDQLRALRSCVYRHKIKPKFTFLGYVPSDGMKAVMSASDILFLSSQMEGIPCVFYEAMAARIPVIGPGVGGITELVLDGITGSVVQVKNGTEFDYKLIRVKEQKRLYTEALLNLLDNPAKAKQMGEAGENRIKAEFSIEKIVQKFIKTVNEKKMQKNLENEASSVCKSFETGPNSKLNEYASIGLVQGPVHMSTASAYCDYID